MSLWLPVTFLMHLLQRHRLVNEVLKEELENGVHALSIVVSMKRLMQKKLGYLFWFIRALTRFSSKFSLYI